jgi:hypothetical protein
MIIPFRNHINLTILAVSIVIVCSGCENQGNRPALGGANKPALLKKAKTLSSFNYTDPTANNYYLAIYSNAVVADATVSVTADNAQRKVRNQILTDLKTTIDYNYHQFEDNLRNDRSVQELGADLATLGLTAASTVMGGAETKTILSAIATGVVGVNSSIDKDFFANNTVQALQLQMRAARAQAEINLRTGMTNSIVNYPLQSGIGDIVSYYYAGSLNDALIGIVQSSGSSAQTNQAKAATIH